MRKLGKGTKHRRSMLKNLSKSLIEHGQIETTLCRAKELRPIVEKLITVAKTSSLHSRRILLSKLQNSHRTVNMLFEIGKNNIDKNGGYTRIIRSGFRTNFEPTAKIQIISQLSQGEQHKEPT